MTLHPDEVRRRLLKLCKYTGDAVFEARLVHVLAERFENLGEQLIKRRVFLSRYMRMTPAEQESVETHLLDQYVRTVTDFLTKEAPVLPERD